MAINVEEKLIEILRSCVKEFNTGWSEYSTRNRILNAMSEESEFCRWQARDIKDLQDCIARLVENRKPDEKSPNGMGVKKWHTLC